MFHNFFASIVSTAFFYHTFAMQALTKLQTKNKKGMFQIILDGLKAKFTGVQDAILTRTATKLAQTATTQEAATTAIEGVDFQSLLQSYGDSRANEAQATAVSNYEKKHGLKDGKPEGTPAPDPAKPDPNKPADEMPQWAKDLQKQNAELKASLDSKSATEVKDQRLAKIKAAIKDAPAPYQNSIMAAFQKAQFTDDADFDAHLTQVSTDATAIVAATTKAGATFGRPMGGHTGGKEEEIPQSILDALEPKKPEDQAF